MRRSKKGKSKRKLSKKIKRQRIKGGDISKKILVCYATPSHAEKQKKLVDSALSVGGIDEVKALGPDDLPEDFKEKYKKFFEHTRGGGYWVWKSYIILEEFKKMNNDDILIYIDSDMIFKISIDSYLENFKPENSIMVFQLWDECLEKIWTKMDIFKRLNCADNINITNTAQIETGYSIYRKNENSLNFLNEWCDLSKDFHLVSDEPSIEANFEEFEENRHEQSLFSCLAKINKDKYHIQIEKTPTELGNVIRNKGFEQLLERNDS